MSRRTVTAAVTALLLGCLSLLGTQARGQAMVTTDKPLYTTGETVTINGAGWDPGETVLIGIREDSLGAPVLISPIADGLGDFSTDEFLVPEGDRTTFFTLECQGQVSGYAAQGFFAAHPPLPPPPSVITDKVDYSPGEVVQISGRNWTPGELVSLTISEDPERHSATFLSAAADANGIFINNDFVVAEDDVGTQFTLHAAAENSGDAAQAVFTDGFLESPPTFMTKWGTAGSGNLNFRSPYAIAIDTSGNVYIADTSNNRIVKYTNTGTFITKWGTRGTGDGQFKGPFGIAVDAQGNVYVTDMDNNRVQKFDSNGTYITKWGSYGSANRYFNSPRGITVGPTGIVYVVDAFNFRVQLFTQSGSYYGKWGSQGSGNDQFQLPWGIEADPSGNVFVVDLGSSRVQKFSMYGVFQGKWGVYGTGEGMFRSPVGVTTDAAGNVYVADEYNNRIQKFTGNGMFLTMWGAAGSGDGQFSSPADVVCGSGGKVYVVDRWNNRIQVFAPPPTGGVVGYVRAICPNPGTGISGVSVAAYKDGPGQTLVRGTVTDASGHYRIGDLLAGAYWIRVVPPGHLNADVNDLPVVVSSGADAAASFNLVDIVSPEPTLLYLPDVLGECSASINAPPTAYDNCSGVVVGTTGDPLTYTAQGIFTVHWNYVDASGNQCDQNQRVIVHDATAPLIEAPAAVPAVARYGEAGCVTYVSDEALGSVVVSDNCSGPVAVTRAGVPGGNLFPLGTTTISWTATDAAGNSASATQDVVVSPAPGAIAGRVLADCPSPGTGLLGVRLDVFNEEGDHIGTTVTDSAGAYEVHGLAPSQPLTVTAVTPLGYLALVEDQAAQIECGETVALDFALSCVEIVANPRSSGFWKHQVGVATGGPGSAQIDGPTLCTYLDAIAEHFNSNGYNQVIVYDPPASGECADKLEVAKTLLNLKGNVGMTARARQQLISLLFNVVAGYVGQQQVVSQDGATLSQAITYCDYLIDGHISGHETAKTIAEQINNNLIVPADVIPLSTEHIAYRRNVGSSTISLGQNQPNPFRNVTVIRYGLPRGGDVRLTVHDVAGRAVAVLKDQAMSAGWHTVPWDGRDGSGNRLAAGIYMYRLEVRAEGERAPRTFDRKMMVLR